MHKNYVQQMQLERNKVAISVNELKSWYNRPSYFRKELTCKELFDLVGMLMIHDNYLHKLKSLYPILRQLYI